MKGLFFKLKDSHHTYGLESINDDCYIALRNYFVKHYDDTALIFCEKISKEIGFPIKGIN